MSNQMQQSQGTPDVPIAFVLLDQKIFLDGKKVEVAVRGSYPALKFQSMGSAARSGTLLFRCEKMSVVVLYMDVPIPSGWEPVAERISPQWPEAVEVISRHQAHLVVTVMGLETTRLEAARTVSAFVSAVLSVYLKASSVVWDSTVVSSKQVFMSYASEALSAYPKIPHSMWISLHPFRDEATQNIVVASVGLHKFVGREIELQSPENNAITLVERISGLITYLLQHGPVINDGDTIGVSPTERISVHLMKSKHFQGTPVFVATLETIT